MKYSVVWVFLGVCCHAAFGGVGVLTPAEEEDVLALWTKVCADVKQEGAQLGDVKVWCKHSPDSLTELVNHQVTVPQSDLGDQIVFVRPAPVLYKHNVQIQGGGGSAQKTKIYVLPQKSQHEIESTYQPGGTATQKPTVYFLKSDGDNAAGYRYANVPVGAAGYV